jgi:beta-N-acetylhexosaminidase
VVLVCAPALVPEALATLDGRAAPDASVLARVLGRDSREGHGLAVESRYDAARAALSGPDFRVS